MITCTVFQVKNLSLPSKKWPLLKVSSELSNQLLYCTNLAQHFPAWFFRSTLATWIYSISLSWETWTSYIYYCTANLHLRWLARLGMDPTSPSLVHRNFQALFHDHCHRCAAEIRLDDLYRALCSNFLYRDSFSLYPNFDFELCQQPSLLTNFAIRCFVTIFGYPWRVSTKNTPILLEWLFKVPRSSWTV